MVDINGKLSVVMPAYNEGSCIYVNVLKTIEILHKFVDNFEIIVVNDGSKDNTKLEIQRVIQCDDRVRMVSSESNHGKGAAIIAGISETCGEYIAFVDADLELNPDQLEGFLIKMVDDKKDAIIGCKLHKDSEIEYPFIRKFMSMGYYVMLLILFQLNVKDTQTGLKLFKAEAIKPVAHLIRTAGFAYDIEILAAIHRRGYSIGQMPVKVVYVREKGSRRIRIKDVLKAFNDTWAIFYRLNFKKYYD
ncbi:glycosyltransferase [[Clostridium] fimetarium]|uniref:Glycosyltransferase involved in cell wall bisynthesis n=1 Tax=[Clostridium] fimetarium TaxID=99656 RepID=A0A1I0P1M1_9FIRM|nr:glycosyltransferase [[Clostridium] fimetarium]SEW07870.1 Glycosyltransferase involved in cell wall bisynthesis [[Clostridium] fimetarium]